MMPPFDPFHPLEDIRNKVLLPIIDQHHHEEGH